MFSKNTSLHSQPAAPKCLLESPASISLAELIACRFELRGLMLAPNKRSAASFDRNVRAVFKGRGMDFDEVRPYAAGDDVRLLDWKVTARSGRPHTKVFREERERPVYIGLDLRAPMFFATQGLFKSVWATYAAALLAWSVSSRGDRLGGVLIADQDLVDIKPGRGHHAVLQFFKRITDLPIWKSPGGVTSLSAVLLNRALLSLHRHARPGSLVVLFSDFRGFNASARARLLGLAQHYQVVLIYCYDPFEETLPAAGMACVSNGGAELELDLAQTRLRAHYQGRFKERLDAVIALRNISGIRVITAKTIDDPLSVMARLLRGAK